MQIPFLPLPAPYSLIWCALFSSLAFLQLSSRQDIPKRCDREWPTACYLISSRDTSMTRFPPGLNNAKEDFYDRLSSWPLTTKKISQIQSRVSPSRFMSPSTSDLPRSSNSVFPASDQTLSAIPSGDTASNALPDTSTDSDPNQKRKKFTPWEDAIERAEKKANESAGRPNSWIKRKGNVLLLVMIVGWTIYVVVVRICVRMIRGRAFSKGRGISFLIVFILLLFMFCWSYLKIILTGPGLAKDHAFTRQSSNHLEGLPYPSSSQSALAPPLPPSQAGPPLFLTKQTPAGPIVSPETKESSCPLVPPLFEERRSQVIDSTQKRMSDSISDGELLERMPMEPEQTGRWCGYCQLEKPPRTHHCRVCGTCILNFDHHCGWTGGCVGQQNHKHFLVFAIWSTIFTGYVLIITALSLRGLKYDGMLISVIVLSTIFTTFTFLLVVSHAWMIYNNLSTLEARIISDFRERESAFLSARFGFFQNSRKKANIKAWKTEWGSPYKEGNRWFLGHKRNWEGIMGSVSWKWFLPLGTPVDKGTTYDQNPRVGPDGGWRKRVFWPEEFK